MDKISGVMGSRANKKCYIWKKNYRKDRQKNTMRLFDGREISPYFPTHANTEISVE